MTLPKLHFKIFMLLGSFIPLLTQCLPEGPNYLVDSYEGMITVTTDSASTSAFNTLSIHKSKTYTNFMSLNGVNYEFLSNGNHLIIDDTLQKEVNGFLYADGDIYIEGDSLRLNMHVSQFTADTTLYFQSTHQGTLFHIQ
ncbi:MAG: hypothetical protein O2862_06685 [Bacteroidetes bacterium]|jgi:hypothetical protein|nr:hypothetical protein [Bacteroidota bacterium]